MSLALFSFLCFYPQQKSSHDRTEIVGVWRRLGAFYLDFMIVLIGITPLLALPLLIQESSYTGQFVWSFEREFSRSTDSNYILPGVGLAFWFLFYYFYKHPKSGRQTIGQYVLGYKVVSNTDEPSDAEFGVRVFYSYIGLCAGPISLYLALKNPDKAFWWDSATNTKVIRVAVVNQSLQQMPAE
ncbi:RDD family protein [Aliikangiella maris]|uniref:RDD family protein n=2 Tax=Aliikangiella maris TaxID=3162458 RepID=A0ABV2BZV6_9GAMM